MVARKWVFHYNAGLMWCPVSFRAQQCWVIKTAFLGVRFPCLFVLGKVLNICWSGRFRGATLASCQILVWHTERKTTKIWKRDEIGRQLYWRLTKEKTALTETEHDDKLRFLVCILRGKLQWSFACRPTLMLNINLHLSSQNGSGSSMTGSFLIKIIQKWPPLANTINHNN